jgi:hypothetical protein
MNQPGHNSNHNANTNTSHPKHPPQRTVWFPSFAGQFLEQRSRELSRLFSGTRFSKRSTPSNKREGIHMLGTIALILIVLWLLGLVSSYTIGGLIHLLLVVAVVLLLLQIIRGRRVL